ncbi:Aste57867_3033 [Aphanomyces stellatus]|uniref:Aste57867_3033 protein n=1 Tax=Aphanomyces stellatus TaxID=120398 RepID=A0A485KCM3_9STRA|nr:hypothetical protein As57867_003024 [Aphanomyces stellatus]VFT80213.1 Aste57867_3033 [Aphanomyces stellatus]
MPQAPRSCSAVRHKVLLSVTPAQLDVLEPAIWALWEFGPTAIGKVSRADLSDWVTHGELAVVVGVKPGLGDARKIELALEEAIQCGQPCPSIVVLATHRATCIRDAARAVRFLATYACPPFVYTPSLFPVVKMDVSQGLYWLDSHTYDSSFAPFDASWLPRIDVGHDLVLYSGSGFIHKSIRGTGLFDTLTTQKALSFRPHLQHAVATGHTFYFFFWTSNAGGGARLALAQFKTIGRFLAAVWPTLSDTTARLPVAAVRVLRWEGCHDALQYPTTHYLVWLDPRVAQLLGSKL